MPTTRNITIPKPRTRTVQVKGLVFAVAGKEPDYPVYHFSGKKFYERPNHNPFD